MITVFALWWTESALACVCGVLGPVYPFTDPTGEVNRLPANGVIYFHEWEPGAYDESDYRLVDEEGARVPVDLERYAEHGYSTVIEMHIIDDRTVGETLYLQWGQADPPASMEWVIDREADHEPPELLYAKFGPRHRYDNSSCGTWQFAQLELDVASDPDEFIVKRMQHANGEYWHNSANYTDLCGGLPLHDFGGRRDIWIVDQAGNRSNVLRIGGPGGCGCSAVGPVSASWWALGIFLLAARRWRSGGSPGATPGPTLRAASGAGGTPGRGD